MPKQKNEFSLPKGIMVTVVCPSPIESSNAPDTSTSSHWGVKEVGGGVDLYTEEDIDGVREEWSSYAATFIFNFLCSKIEDIQQLGCLRRFFSLLPLSSLFSRLNFWR